MANSDKEFKILLNKGKERGIKKGEIDFEILMLFVKNSKKVRGESIEFLKKKFQKNEKKNLLHILF